MSWSLSHVQSCFIKRNTKWISCVWILKFQQMIHLLIFEQLFSIRFLFFSPHVNAAPICLLGFYKLKACLRTVADDFGENCLFHQCVKLTTFHPLLFYKRNAKWISEFWYCDILDCFLILEKMKTLTWRLRVFCFSLFSNPATFLIFESHNRNTKIYSKLLNYRRYQIQPNSRLLLLHIYKF